MRPFRILDIRGRAGLFQFDGTVGDLEGDTPVPPTNTFPRQRRDEKNDGNDVPELEYYKYN